MNKKFISGYWYANAYEQFENQTDDVEFFIKILNKETDGTPLNILEVACGGGRISVPLARAGHCVTGFDADEFALMRFYKKAANIPNISCCQVDAISDDWGTDFDVVVMAGNILINIETKIDYTEAQKLFIIKSAKALRRGGRLLLDYDQHSEASAIKFFNRLAENGSGRLGVEKEYSDDLGTIGKFKIYGGVYDPVTRICTWASHRELKTNNGELIIESTTGYKHIPTFEQVNKWLDDAGFIIKKTYKNYTNEPLSENESDYVKATIWAEKK